MLWLLKIAISTIEMPLDKQNRFIFSMGSLSKWLSLVIFYCKVNLKAKTVLNGSKAISAWKYTTKTNFYISDTFPVKTGTNNKIVTFCYEVNCLKFRALSKKKEENELRVERASSTCARTLNVNLEKFSCEGINMPASHWGGLRRTELVFFLFSESARNFKQFTS